MRANGLRVRSDKHGNRLICRNGKDANRVRYKNVARECGPTKADSAATDISAPHRIAGDASAWVDGSRRKRLARLLHVCQSEGPSPVCASGYLSMKGLYGGLPFGLAVMVTKTCCTCGNRLIKASISADLASGRTQPST